MTRLPNTGDGRPLERRNGSRGMIVAKPRHLSAVGKRATGQLATTRPLATCRRPPADGHISVLALCASVMIASFLVLLTIPFAASLLAGLGLEDEAVVAGVPYFIFGGKAFEEGSRLVMLFTRFHGGIWLKEAPIPSR